MKKDWIANVALYTAGGLLSSTLLGLLLGAIGEAGLPSASKRTTIMIAAAIGVLAMAREAGVIPIPLPQLKRQTPEVWRFMLSPSATAALWGFDLGFMFSTWITFAGPWFVAAVAVAYQDPGFGAALFATYWLGRACWMWAAPYLLTSPTATPQVADGIARLRGAFAWIHVIGLACGIGALLMTASR